MKFKVGHLKTFKLQGLDWIPVGEEEGCPDVEFDGVVIPECNVDVGVGESLYLCKHESVKDLDCNELLRKYENREISAEQLMKTVADHSDSPIIHYNLDMIRRVVKEEPMDD